MVRAVKNGFANHKFTVPIFGVTSGSSQSVIDELVRTGVDDLISCTEALEVVLKRVSLRDQQIQNQMKFERMMLEQSARNAETLTSISQREEFLSVCAHDLRSPLGLIQSSLSLVLNSAEGNLTDIQKELIHRARRQAGDEIGRAHV